MYTKPSRLKNALFHSPSTHATAAAAAMSTHILVFPYPAQGHMLPLLDLTNQLALRGFKITILTTPGNLPILSPFLSAHPPIQTLILPFPSHPKLPAGVEHMRNVGNHANHLMVAALSGLAGPIAHWFKSHPSPPRAILSDFFLGFTLRLAQDLGIPRIAFYTSGSFVSSVCNTLFSDVARFKALDSVEFTNLPRSPVFKEHHLPSVFRFFNEFDPNSQAVKDGLMANFSSWGCVFNSFRALEVDYLDYIRSLTLNGRVYGVGPLSLFKESATLSRVNPDQGPSCEVLSWLDDCPDDSVLYASFGSQKLLTEPQLQALAQALEKSGTRFIWVVRSTEPDSQGGGSVLNGFEERTADRGYVVRGWAPQVEILGHRATGGFLSHCGWNSVLESVVAGVMIVAWPMEADQYVNARLMVDDMGAAVLACEGPETVPDPEELGRVIREAMAMAQDAPQQRMAKKLKKEALAAVRDGGSSAKDLDEFVWELSRIGTESSQL